MKMIACVASAILASSIYAADVVAPTNTQPVIANMSAKAMKSLTATGLVISVDMVGNTLTIEGKKKATLVFSVPATAKILEGKKSIVLGDIAIGFKVAVKYTKDGDTLQASKIQVLVAKKASAIPKSK